MISAPFELFAYLVALTGLIFWIGSMPRFQGFFRVLPPVVWVYVIPSVITSVGLTPAESPGYSTMRYYLLPFALFLLTISVDVKAILKLGRVALTMLLVGTAGIIIGMSVSYMVFRAWLPADGWQSLASLSGSWIGGTANMLAIQQSLEAPDTILGPIVIVDSVVGYGWMGILIFLAAFQNKFDRWLDADRSSINALEVRLAEYRQHRVPTDLSHLAVIVALGLGMAVLTRNLSAGLPELGDPTVISASTWAMLIVVTFGLVLSFTPVRKLEYSGASTVGYYALYLLVASVGASADIAGLQETPAFALAGALTIVIHVGLLVLAAKLIKAPFFFVATGSMANVGGALSAPIVAGVYMPALAPVGLLMAVAGYILGIYAALGGAKILAILSTL